MRKTILITGLACLCLIQSKAQINLNWNSSFSPAWSNGATSRTATNIGGNSINCTVAVSMTGPGAFQQAAGNSGAQTPTVNGGMFSIPGSSGNLHITTNYSQNTSYTTVVISFTAMTTNLILRIGDIDKNDATSTTYFDRVTVTGSNGSTSFNPTISKYDAVTDPNFLVISGNRVNVNTTSGQAGNTNTDATDQRGTVDVDFGSSVLNSVTIVYDNAPGANNNPSNQAIAIGLVSFNQSTLPVQLTDFSGFRKNNDVELNWKTAQEFNSAYFDVERNTGNLWEKIGSVTAAGFSSTEQQYRFTDSNPRGNLLLYRLRQVDQDNHSKYSNVVRISTASSQTDLQVYPNPFRDQISVGFNSAAPQNISILITDLSGKTIQSYNRQVVTGNNNIHLTGLAQLPKGIYHLLIRDESGTITGNTKILRE